MRPVACLAFAIAALGWGSPVFAHIEKFPASFHSERIKTSDGTIYVRVGGKGPAVVMLHGFGYTGDMWAPLAKAMFKDHTVSCRTCTAWATRRIPTTAATTRRPRHAASPW
jgi:pimeloyl-ACP methyl ester carboxylesterase